jgi:MFS transporter, FSR family, fosmidomycin resistance protein
VLTAIDFFDELASGLPPAGAPDLRAEFSTSVTLLTLLVFTAPQLFSILVDTPLLIWAERRPRAQMVALGLAGMGVSLLGAGLARSALEFGIAFALFGPCSGLACGLAQAALMDSDPDQRERRMAGWAFAGMLGDLAAPLAMAGVAAASFSFRTAWLGVGASLLLAALAARRLRLQNLAAAAPGDDAPSFWVGLQNKRLMIWQTGVALCSLLDETLTALVALWTKQQFPEDPHAVTVVLTASTLGGALGLVLLDRLLLRFAARRILAVACTLCLSLYFFWLHSRSLYGSALWMFFVGAFTAMQYPIAQAQAYRAAADRSGLVAAVGPIFSGLDLVSPLVLGLIADRFGLYAALVALLVQPIGLFAIARIQPQSPAAPAAD